MAEVKEGPLELRSEEGKGDSPGGMRRGQKGAGPSVLKVFRAEILGEGPGEDLNRILCHFPGVSFRV